MLSGSENQAAGSGFAPFQGREGTLSCESLQHPLPSRIGGGTVHRKQFLERRSLARPNRTLLRVSSREGIVQHPQEPPFCFARLYFPSSCAWRGAASLWHGEMCDHGLSEQPRAQNGAAAEDPSPACARSYLSAFTDSCAGLIFSCRCTSYALLQGSARYLIAVL